MKSINILLSLIALCGLLCIGCSDFLEEDPSAIGTAETYFPTSDGLDGALNACYSSLRAIYNTRDLWLTGIDQFSGANGYPTEKDPGTYTNIDVYSNQSLSSSNSTINTLWQRCYIGIDRCNRMLSLAPEADVSASVKAVKVEEAKTLRAYYYYHLVEQFGAVPFPLEPYAELQTTAERVPEETIYAQLISDLEQAQSVLPATAAQFGRVTKGVAQFLLAKLYLTRGYKSFGKSDDFTKAAQYADLIINSGTYRLLDDFRMIFVPGNEKNEEIIFSIQWTKDKVLAVWDWSTSSWGNNAHSKFGIAYDNFNGGQRSNYYNRWLRTYNENFYSLDCFGVDTVTHPGRSYVVPPLLESLNIHPVNHSYKIDKRYDATFRRLTMTEVSMEASKRYGPDKTTKWQVWSAGVGSGTSNLTYDMSQVDLNVNYWEGTGRDTSMYIPAPDENHLWPMERCIVLPYGVLPRSVWFLDENSDASRMMNEAYGKIGSVWFHTDWLQVRPSLAKFWEPESQYNDNMGVRDMFLMRLGEVYLIAAEAYYKANNPTLAAERINTIRRRACGSNYMDIKPEEVDIDFILDERTRELVGEELRWNELKRTGKLIERTLRYNWWANSPYIPGGKPYLQEFHLLRPLPYNWWSLLSNKDEVPQNPGY